MNKCPMILTYIEINISFTVAEYFPKKTSCIFSSISDDLIFIDIDFLHPGYFTNDII